MADWSDFTITMTRGDTLRLQIAVATGGVADDITGWKFWVTGKANPLDRDSSAVFQVSSPTGVVPSNAPLGLCVATVPATATAALANHRRQLYVDVQARDTSSRITTLARGTLIMLAEVTQATS